MVNSMTGFAARRGEGAGAAWSWEIRSVNGRGLDLRLRLPEGIEGLEPAVRAELGRRLHRGTVSVTLRLERTAAAGAIGVDPAALRAALGALAAVEAAAEEAGLPLAPSTAAAVLALPGVMLRAAPEAESEALRAALMADFAELLEAFLAARAAEGAALAAVLAGQIDRIEALADEAAAAAEARRGEAAEALRAAVARILGATEAVDPARLAQELALLAVRTDVTEELDRLAAHVAGARALLAEGGPVGRRLDFLAQEFNREANTLCSKAGNAALTRIGLELKAVIDQFREQVQNLE